MPELNREVSTAEVFRGRLSAKVMRTRSPLCVSFSFLFERIRLGPFFFFYPVHFKNKYVTGFLLQHKAHYVSLSCVILIPIFVLHLFVPVSAVPSLISFCNNENKNDSARSSKARKERVVLVV